MACDPAGRRPRQRLAFAVDPDADPRLAPRGAESWGDRRGPDLSLPDQIGRPRSRRCSGKPWERSCSLLAFLNGEYSQPAIPCRYSTPAVPAPRTARPGRAAPRRQCSGRSRPAWAGSRGRSCAVPGRRPPRGPGHGRSPSRWPDSSKARSAGTAPPRRFPNCGRTGSRRRSGSAPASAPSRCRTSGTCLAIRALGRRTPGQMESPPRPVSVEAEEGVPVLFAGRRQWGRDLEPTRASRRSRRMVLRRPDDRAPRKSSKSR